MTAMVTPLPVIRPPRPWYRQFWPWFLIALPAISVVFSVLTLVIAVRNADSLVRDDYYKAGLALNREFALERAAAARALRAELRVAGETIAVALAGDGIDARSELVLVLAHPTAAARDLELRLRGASDGVWRATLPAPLHGPWHASLMPAGGGWRLAARIDFDAPAPPVLGGT